MKNNLKFIIALFIFISVLFACDNKNETKTSDSNSKKNIKSVIKDGKVGKYTYSYSEQEGKIVVLFDGKGVEGVEKSNNKTIYEDLSILLTLASTINSISGFEDIEISSLANQLKKMDTSDGVIRLVGKNCTYKIMFVANGSYIKDFIYTKCN